MELSETTGDRRLNVPARKSALENIIQFFMTASPDAVRTAQEAIRGVLASRSDLKPAATNTGKRRGRKPRQPELPTENNEQ